MPLWQPSNAIARPAYYDRDPIPAIANYADQIPPAGSTVRASYIPPNGYAAFIEAMFLFTYRGVVAAAPSIVQFYVNFRPFTGGVYRVAQVQQNTNVLFEDKTLVSGNFGYMAFGDQIDLITFDGSTGGQQAFGGTVKGTEFLY